VDYLPARARVLATLPIRRIASRLRRKAAPSQRRGGDRLRVKIVTMLKNEDELALKWVKYHASMVGYENLILLDNGSDSADTRAALTWASEQGANVSAAFSKQADFVKRGSIIGNIIKRLDAEDPADFYFPLDCDEFLSVWSDGRLDCSREGLEAELSRWLDCERPLLIYAGLDNSPHKPGFFRWSLGQRKMFFARDACVFLDHGFHCGMTRAGGEPERTKIVYIHYHFKPYGLLVAHSKAKLAPFTSDFSVDNMKKHVAGRKHAWHCAEHLLRTPEDYALSFACEMFLPFPEVAPKFASINEALPFSTSD
jgi:hypothetical protein